MGGISFAEGAGSVIFLSVSFGDISVGSTELFSELIVLPTRDTHLKFIANHILSSTFLTSFSETSQQRGPVVFFMKKLWLNAHPGIDKTADRLFHYPQVRQSRKGALS